jgi:Rrf2 family nitric oxide-sensitive transcriptional repressor
VRLSTFTDYSLRVLIYLAAQPGRRATIAEIAASFEVSQHHLTKVVHFLGKQGWLANVRGKGGGLGLAQAPHQLSVGQVVRATEGVIAPAECFGEVADTCCIERICRLRGVLGEAVEAFYEVLDGYHIGDLVHNRTKLARVLFIQTGTNNHEPIPVD